MSQYDVREDFAEYCVMVETEFAPLEDAGVFDHDLFNVITRADINQIANGLGIPECSAEEIREELKEYDRVMELRARCRKYWPLQIAKRKIQRVIDYQASTQCDEDELQKLMVVTMLVLTQARECISHDTNQEYITLLMKLRLNGRIDRKLLQKYSMINGLLELVI